MITHTVGSLCTGYGGLELGLESAFGSVRHLWHAENDPAASHVLKQHYPDVPNLGDITEIDYDTVSLVDVLCMGVPCQAVSAAGRQRGDADPRWLWPEARRAAAALRPSVIVFENVRNLVSYRKGELWRGILADLRGLGYAARWTIVGACAAVVGGCHHRHRVFLIAWRVTGDAPEAIRLDVPACGASRSASAVSPTALSYGTNQGGAAGRVGPIRPSLETLAVMLPSPVARDADGRGEGGAEYWAKRGEDRTNGLPLGAVAAMLPSPAARDGGTRGTATPEHAARRRADGHQLDLPDAVSLLSSPRATDAQKSSSNGNWERDRTNICMPQAVQVRNFGRYADAVERWSARFGEPPEPTEIGPKGGVRLAPAFPEWMMGLPRGYVTDHVERRDALRIIGNGVMPHAAAHAFKLLIDEQE